MTRYNVNEKSNFHKDYEKIHKRTGDATLSDIHDVLTDILIELQFIANNTHSDNVTYEDNREIKMFKAPGDENCDW